MGDDRERMTHQLLMPSAWITPALLQDGATGGGVLGPTGTTGEAGQTTAPPPGAPGDTGASSQGGFDMFFLILLMFGGMILIMSLSGRKEKKRRAQMLRELGKKDKVRTAGGIIGTVIEMKDDEVLLETDRASHTRLWLTKGSISAVIKQVKTTEPESAEEPQPTTNA